jgi:hypothetical protein
MAKSNRGAPRGSKKQLTPKRAPQVRRAHQLRDSITKLRSTPGQPSTPREFTDAAASAARKRAKKKQRQ